MNEIARARDRLRALPPAELDARCRRHDVRVLTLFGSAVTDDDPADLDLGVVFEPGSDHDVPGLLEDLVDLLGVEAIDVLDAPRASETARVRAIADGMGLYESEPTADAMAAAADALFMEMADYHRAALDALGA